jgi:hypothetical protein
MGRRAGRSGCAAQQQDSFAPRLPPFLLDAVASAALHFDGAGCAPCWLLAWPPCGAFLTAMTDLM